MGTCVVLAAVAFRRRTRLNVLAAVGYFLSAMIFFIGVQYVPTNGGPVPDAVVMPFFLINWLGGSVHVLLLQLGTQRQPHHTGAPYTSDPALSAAVWRANRRQETREALLRNPSLAAELRVGRPDLPERRYDDGGLVDVNHVPVATLVTELEMPIPVAESVVRERAHLGGFTSPDELLVYCAGLTPERLAIIRDRLVFIPL
jgi:hypothetical protein